MSFISNFQSIVEYLNINSRFKYYRFFHYKTSLIHMMKNHCIFMQFTHKFQNEFPESKFCKYIFPKEQNIDIL